MRVAGVCVEDMEYRGIWKSWARVIDPEYWTEGEAEEKYLEFVIL